MKKRLTAWLLVFCMALSLLPGTAFAAEGGGDDGKVTITYDLNDGISDYQLQLKTTPGQEPGNEPGAKWAGRPFAGWSSDKAGKVAPDYNKDTTLYAQWLSGYKVTLTWNPTGITDIQGLPTVASPEYTTESSGKLSADDVDKIQEIIQGVEQYGKYAFDGWYLECEKNPDTGKYTYRRPFGDITNTIDTNGMILYAKWMPIYTITFKYHNGPLDSTGSPSDTNLETVDQIIRTTTGGVLEKLPPTPTFRGEPFSFGGWYILDNSTPPKIPGSNTLPKFSTLTGTGFKLPDNLATYDFSTVAEALGEHEITVEANWTVPFGIIFDANGGYFGNNPNNTKTTIKTDTSGYIDEDDWPKDQVKDKDPNGYIREGYKFLGWYKVKDSTSDDDKLKPGETFNKPTTVYASWKKLTKVTIFYNAKSATDNPTEIRYVDPASDDPDDWTVKDLQSLLDAAGTTVKKEGYTFRNMWSVKIGDAVTEMTPQNVINLKFEAGKDTIITALWTPGYIISFDYNGATKVGTGTDPDKWLTRASTDTRGYLKPSDLPPTPERDGYHFDGWYIGNKPLEDTKVYETADIYYYNVGQASQTITAYWGPPYTITLNYNEADNAPADTTTILSDSNGKYLLPSPEPAKIGVRFKGWFVADANGNASGSAIKAGDTCTGPGTLIAEWENFTITLDPNGRPGTSTTTKTTKDGKLTADDLAELPFYTDSTYVYTCTGWYTARTGGTKVDANYVFSDNVTIYAQWSRTTPPSPTAPISAPKKLPAASKPAATAGTPMLTAADGEFDITFDLAGGKLPEGVEDKAETIGQKLSTLPTPTKEGWTFQGWFATIGGKKTQIVAGTDGTTFTANTPVTAEWGAPFTITFDLNGGEGAAPAPQQTEATGVLALTKWPSEDTIKREGYKFDGWYSEDGTTTHFTPDYEFKKPETVYAKWTPVGYTITFVHNDGTDTRTIRQTTDDNGKQVVKPSPEPTRPGGYSFAGWYTAETGGIRVVPNTFNFTTATTLYAHWTKEITVTFHHNNLTEKTTVVTTQDGEWVKNGTNTEATSFTDLLDDPTFGGHTFAGWYNDATGGNRFQSPSEITGDMDLYAHWTEAEVEITFMDDGTEVAKQMTVNGKIDKFPDIPNRIGYRFDGWFTDSSDPPDPTTKVTADTIFSRSTTLYAYWTDITNPDPSDPSLKYPVVTFIVDVPNPLEDAAHFTMKVSGNTGYLSQLPVLLGRDEADGWRLESGRHVDEGQLYTKDTDLYIDVAKTILVTFDWNNAKDGGTSSKTTVRTNKDGKIDEDKWPDELAKDKNPGYHFDNWYTEATGGTIVPKLTVFKEPTTIYAHWKGPFTVTFDANGGKFPDGETTKGVETDDDGNLDPTKIPADPTREGYTKFGGWSLTKDGTEAVEPDAQPYTGAATLYAIWGPPYAIEYDAMGGEVTVTDEQKLTTEDGKYPELPVPTHSRDSFGGWYTTKDYQEGTLATAGGDCPGAVTLYAKWTREPPYTITFNANLEGAVMEDPTSGSSVTTLTLKTDDKGVLMQAPPEPTIRGGKFQGWYTKAEEGTGELISDVATRTFEDDTTLYAHWDTMEFTITFDFNLSSIGKDFNITTYTTTKGKSLSFLPGELPQAASETKKIEGWYTVPNPVVGKDQPVTTSNTFERDTTLYAKWVDAPDLPIVFKYPNVTFLDAENGNAMVTLEVDKDYKMASVPPGPYKEGLTFTGWFYREPDRPDGEEKQFTKDTEVTGSLRVYPKYVGSGYTITFEPGEESELDPIEVKTTSEGRIPDGSMPSPTWEGHTFTGWYTSAEGGTRITRRTVFTQDTTVYAHWDKDGDPDDPNNPDNPDQPDGPTSPPFTITFDANGGNLTTASTALTDMNGRLMSLPTPLRTGYRLNGWYKGNERVTTATVFTANTTITAQWTTGTGGGSGDSGDINGYAITVANTTGGRVNVSTTYAREGDRVTVTVRPYSGYQLDRLDVTNARGYDVDLRDQGSNRYVFYMPASRVTVDAVFMELVANSGNTGNTGNTGGSGSTGGDSSWNPGGTVTPPSGGGATSGMGIFSQPVLNTVPMPYLDVHASDWYYSSVDYMWQRQLMGGVSSNRFGPQSTTSNAMVWTILARLAGVDVTSGASVWYENARSWAVSNRISDGVGPNSPVTREQLATMLWNYKGSPAVGYDLGQFGDRGQISTYQAECALRWAVANNIVSGTGNRLNPRGTATRAEVAAMITRFCQNT